MLSWYDGNARKLPWRVRGARADPYLVWLSEVMLQQTGVAIVAPFFVRFLGLWPDVASLAAAPREAVLEAWAGLGYYSRARNLHVAARVLAEQGFPDSEAGWRALPGVGPYTAAAIAAIALGQPANAVDGNVERVMARLYAAANPLPWAKAELTGLAAALVTAHRPGDWAQALMDLGAIVCTPRAPRCPACPWTKACAARAAGAPERYPVRAPKPARPQRFGAVFRAEKGEALWLVRRGEHGLLAGMAGLPTTPWRARKWRPAEALALAPCAGDWRRAGQVRQAFTHFSLTLDVYAARARPESEGCWGEGWWGDAAALPSIFRKAARV